MGELLASISSEELTEWAAYYKIDPFGNYRSDLQSAVIASTIANVHAQKGKSYQPADFLLTFDQGPPKAMTQSETHNYLKRMLGNA